MGTMRMTPDGKAQAQNVIAAAAEGEQVVGTIKSFSAQRGWGFCSVEGRPGDAYIKKSELPVELQELDGESLQGMQLAFSVHLTPDGKMQVREAQSTGQRSAIAGFKRPASAMQQASAKRMKVEGGMGCMVKSYNAQKGWGFLQSSDISGDVYFQRKLLPPNLMDAQI